MSKHYTESHIVNFVSFAGYIVLWELFKSAVIAQKYPETIYKLMSVAGGPAAFSLPAPRIT